LWDVDEWWWDLDEWWLGSVMYRSGWFGEFKHPLPRNSQDIGAVLDSMSKKNQRLDFLL